MTCRGHHVEASTPLTALEHNLNCLKVVSGKRNSITRIAGGPGHTPKFLAPYTVTPVKLKLASFRAGTRVAKPTSLSTSFASRPTASTWAKAST